MCNRWNRRDGAGRPLSCTLTRNQTVPLQLEESVADVHCSCCSEHTQGDMRGYLEDTLGGGRRVLTAGHLLGRAGRDWTACTGGWMSGCVCALCSGRGILSTNTARADIAWCDGRAAQPVCTSLFLELVSVRPSFDDLCPLPAEPKGSFICWRRVPASPTRAEPRGDRPPLPLRLSPCFPPFPSMSRGALTPSLAR